jgi:DNA-binding NarL/FixJ family response regulator
MNAIRQEDKSAGGTGGTPETAETPDAFAARCGLAGEERRIFDAVVRGSGNKDIAYDEKLSLSAVKRRIHVLYRKLGVASRFELMAKVRGTSQDPIKAD